jgi:hypothetical protein
MKCLFQMLAGSDQNRTFAFGHTAVQSDSCYRDLSASKVSSSKHDSSVISRIHTAL